MSHVRVATVQRFYEDNRQGLFTYALSLTGSPAAAEDAVQTAILRLLRRPWLPRELRPYAYRCIRNAAIDAWRRQRPSPAESIFAPDAPDHSLAEHLSALLAQLSADEREVIVLILRRPHLSRDRRRQTLLAQHRRLTIPAPPRQVASRSVQALPK